MLLKQNSRAEGVRLEVREPLGRPLRPARAWQSWLRRAAVICGLAVMGAPSSANATLIGQNFAVTFEHTGSPMYPDPMSIAMGTWQAVSGAEWTSTTAVYDFSDPESPVFLGNRTKTIDITETQITWSWEFDVNPGVDSSFVYQIPGAFTGWVFEFSDPGALPISSVSYSAYGPGIGHIGQLDHWANSDPADPTTEAFVDSHYLAPGDSSRVEIVGDHTIRLNLQGISWQQNTPAGQSYSGGVTVGVNLVPEPSTALLVSAGLGWLALRRRPRRAA